jgi:FKBP-type peptidyl-prolyl cis-trans isomerase 2
VNPVAVGPDTVVSMNANHPLAGMALRFFCTITAVRQATKEELSRKEAFYHCDP